MLNDTEEILEGTNEVVRRLEAIRNSRAVLEYIENIKHEVENSGMRVTFKSRIKENESAISKYKKYIEERGIKEPGIQDSCGTMVIVDDIEEVYEMVEFLKVS